jgi:hypothetical protein
VTVKKPTPLNMLRDMINELCSSYANWAENDPLGSMPESLTDKFDQLIMLYLDNPLVQPCAQHAVYDLIQSKKRFDDYKPLYDDQPWTPPSEMANALDMARKMLMAETPRLANHPMPAKLIEQRVSHTQIAHMWRLFTADGHPDTEAVNLELATPGSIITPQHIEYVNNVRLAAMGFGPLAEINTDLFDHIEPPAPKEPPAAPARPEFDYFEKGILDGDFIENMAKRKSEQYGTPIDLWREGIRNIAELMNRKVFANATEYTNAGGREISESRFGKGVVDRDWSNNEPPPLREAQKPVPTADRNEAILRLHAEGHDLAAIAKETGLPLRMVKKAIEQHEQTEPAAT